LKEGEEIKSTKPKQLDNERNKDCQNHEENDEK
jgi:hypothetical protein